MTELDHTHDAAARSWVESANEAKCDFPVQNLPFAVFRRAGSRESFRCGVAIGDQALDLAALSTLDVLKGTAAEAVAACQHSQLDRFFATGSKGWHALRHALFELLRDDANGITRHTLQNCLIPLAQAEYGLPASIRNYTDFYTSIHHAANIGRLFNRKDPLPPNFQWIPLAYHGRASSVGVSGQTIRRPFGQLMPTGAVAPSHAPCQRLDYELEIGIFIGVGNAQGEPIALADAEDHVFGICLLNDWSARDIQAWESTPLGPFLSKCFATTVSPWVVTMEALAPYRQQWSRSKADPQPLPYLEHPRNRHGGAFDIRLQAWLETARSRADRTPPLRLSETSFQHQYWTIAQMVTHHTMGGCNLLTGDLLGSGTVSGPTPEEAGALIELSYAGSKPVTLPNGDQRGFIEDGDTIIFKGWCEKPGFARIGFGELRGTVAN